MRSFLLHRLGSKVWAKLDRATPAIVEALGSAGVTDVQYVVGFVRPLEVDVWLVVATDAERDAQASVNPWLDEVREIISAVGLRSKDGTIDSTVCQSQETVDREFEGSWFYALR